MLLSYAILPITRNVMFISSATTLGNNLNSTVIVDQYFVNVI